MGGGRWEVWVDTGGTFTDCLARDPRGRLHRAKVLSSSAVRGTVAEAMGSSRFRVQGFDHLPRDFFSGFSVSRLGGGSGGGSGELLVQGFDPELGIVETTSTSGHGFRGLEAVELRSPEPAPLLAARWVTRTPLWERLPPLSMRLATTRGTNALLERRGAPTALLMTAGLGDLLEIGTQDRPDLFALEIKKPKPLHQAVLEVAERLAADGEVLKPLPEEAVRQGARRLRREGVQAVAVAFLHSYRNPAHELRAAEILREEGFRYVALSSELAPLIQILPRAQTAVVEAYLGPAISAYLDAITAKTGEEPVLVMTSAGGLVRAQGYCAKDSLLSGPAGGVVGAWEAARRSGFRRIVAFDMGGTSTDVARCAGEFSYRFEHRVGGARLLSPALVIETVAAGGGSICSFDGLQLKVGPRSAGAFPGPASYGAGGPLCLTDVNLLLGRLEPEAFPIPLEIGAAETACSAIVRKVRDSTLEEASLEELLEGLLRIANERMAEAIRQISVRQGYDTEDHVLVAFGGAGGQHACAVAELLGITSVLSPGDAGLLSALGLGAASVERFAQRQVLRMLAEVEDRLEDWIATLTEQAMAELVADGVLPGRARVARRIVQLRLHGQDATLPVEYRRGRSLSRSFDRAYREVFGYRPEGRAIEVESIRVVARESSRRRRRSRQETVREETISRSRKRVCLQGRWLEVPVYRRWELSPPFQTRGPALVLDPHSTTLVENGWSARFDHEGGLVLSRAAEGEGS